MEIEVAFDLVSQLFDVDAPGGRVVDEADAIAERERLEDELDGIRPSIRAEQNGRLVTRQLESRRSLARLTPKSCERGM
jgi:hypothetical protein